MFGIRRYSRFPTGEFYHTFTLTFADPALELLWQGTRTRMKARARTTSTIAMGLSFAITVYALSFVLRNLTLPEEEEELLRQRRFGLRGATRLAVLAGPSLALTSVLLSRVIYVVARARRASRAAPPVVPGAVERIGPGDYSGDSGGAGADAAGPNAAGAVSERGRDSGADREASDAALQRLSRAFSQLCLFYPVLHMCLAGPVGQLTLGRTQITDLVMLQVGLMSLGVMMPPFPKSMLGIGSAWIATIAVAADPNFPSPTTVHAALITSLALVASLAMLGACYAFEYIDRAGFLSVVALDKQRTAAVSAFRAIMPAKIAAEVAAQRKAADIVGAIARRPKRAARGRRRAGSKAPRVRGGRVRSGSAVSSVPSSAGPRAGAILSSPCKCQTPARRGGVAGNDDCPNDEASAKSSDDAGCPACGGSVAGASRARRARRRADSAMSSGSLLAARGGVHRARRAPAARAVAPRSTRTVSTSSAASSMLGAWGEMAEEGREGPPGSVSSPPSLTPSMVLAAADAADGLMGAHGAGGIATMIEESPSATVLFVSVSCDEVAERLGPEVFTVLMTKLSLAIDAALEDARSVAPSICSRAWRRRVPDIQKVENQQNLYIITAGSEHPEGPHALWLTVSAIFIDEAVDAFIAAEESLVVGDITLRSGLSTGPIAGGLNGSSGLVWSVYGNAVNMSSRVANWREPGELAAEFGDALEEEEEEGEGEREEGTGGTSARMASRARRRASAMNPFGTLCGPVHLSETTARALAVLNSSHFFASREHEGVSLKGKVGAMTVTSVDGFAPITVELLQRAVKKAARNGTARGGNTSRTRDGFTARSAGLSGILSSRSRPASRHPQLEAGGDGRGGGRGRRRGGAGAGGAGRDDVGTIELASVASSDDSGSTPSRVELASDIFADEKKPSVVLDRISRSLGSATANPRGIAGEDQDLAAGPMKKGRVHESLPLNIPVGDGSGAGEPVKSKASFGRRKKRASPRAEPRVGAVSRFFGGSRAAAEEAAAGVLIAGRGTGGEGHDTRNASRNDGVDDVDNDDDNDAGAGEIAVSREVIAATLEVFEKGHERVARLLRPWSLAFYDVDEERRYAEFAKKELGFVVIAMSGAYVVCSFIVAALIILTDPQEIRDQGIAKGGRPFVAPAVAFLVVVCSLIFFGVAFTTTRTNHRPRSLSSRAREGGGRGGSAYVTSRNGSDRAPTATFGASTVARTVSAGSSDAGSTDALLVAPLPGASPSTSRVSLLGADAAAPNAVGSGSPSAEGGRERARVGGRSEDDGDSSSSSAWGGGLGADGIDGDSVDDVDDDDDDDADDDDDDDGDDVGVPHDTGKFRRWVLAAVSLLQLLLTLPVLTIMSVADAGASVTGMCAFLLCLQTEAIPPVVGIFSFVISSLIVLFQTYIAVTWDPENPEEVPLADPTDDRFFGNVRGAGTYVLVFCALAFLMVYRMRAMKHLSRVVFATKRTSRAERDRFRTLVASSLPSYVAARMIARVNPLREPIADTTPDALVFSCDVQGFTALSSLAKTPGNVLRMLHELYGILDHHAARYGIVKLGTVGDAWIGSTAPLSDVPVFTRAVDGIIPFALDVIASVDAVSRDLASIVTDGASGLRDDEDARDGEGDGPVAHPMDSDVDGPEVRIRAGLSLGRLDTGVIGVKLPMYRAWGSAVRESAFLESQASPGSLLVSAEVAKVLGLAINRWGGRVQVFSEE